jgi:hypothetical protein
MEAAGKALELELCSVGDSIVAVGLEKKGCVQGTDGAFTTMDPTRGIESRLDGLISLRNASERSTVGDTVPELSERTRKREEMGEASTHR